MISVFEKVSLRWATISLLLAFCVGIVGLTDAQSAKVVNIVKQTVNSTDIKNKAINSEKGQIKTADKNVEGKGIIITISNKENLKKEKIIATQAYIKMLLFDLVSAGSQAISINNQTLSSKSEITSKSDVISIGSSLSVNGKQITFPFVIKAIGNQQRLDEFLGLGIFDSYKDTGLQVKKEASDKISIQKPEGNIQLKCFQPYDHNGDLYLKTINSKELSSNPDKHLPTYLTITQAQKKAGFKVQLPTYLPEGYKLYKGLCVFGKENVGVRMRFTKEISYMYDFIEYTVGLAKKGKGVVAEKCSIPGQKYFKFKVGDNDAIIFGTLFQVSVNAYKEIVDYYGHIMVWDKDGMTYSLVDTTAQTIEELVKIAKSIK